MQMFPDRLPVSNPCFDDRRTVHAIFEEQAALRPGAIAVVYENREVTYQELNWRANQLAHYLRKLGVGPDVPVALALERSPEMVIGILGILKAGGAYVPLDPAYPAERLAFMLEDARAPVLLAERRFVDRLPAQRAVAICLDTDSQTIAGEPTENPANRLAPANIAYVIYTSGSTGRPKGVEILHRNLSNYIISAGQFFGLTPADRVLQFSSISFDTAAEEIFCPLTCGATLVLRNDSMLGSVSDFLATCGRWRITVLDLPTAYWHELTGRLFSERLTMPNEVRLVVVGGERALPERLTQWRACIGNRIRFCNSYGPTEATIGATIWELTDSFVAEDSFAEVPIGCPMPNVQVHIVDANLNRVAVGVTGELFIGGAGVARGYRHRPDLTAEKFLPDPFSADASSRLYKTGDLARSRPDGNLQFQGRVDYQVKMRGFRIETEEIETVLRQHPAIWDTVVIAREDVEGDKQLVAYVVPVRGTTPKVSEIRNVLNAKLPHYMIPAAFVFLDALPLTPNGKIDRRALPAPEQTRNALEESYAAPRTQVEEVLARIWAEVLNVDRVGIHDSFFDLGGHSLLAVRIISEIERAFGKTQRLSALFQAPTVEQFAELLSQDVVSESWSSLIPLQPHGSKLPFFWIHGESSDASLPRHLGADQPLYGLMHQGLDGNAIRYTTVEEIAAHYLREIRSVQPNGPYFLGGYCFGGLIAFEMAQQLRKINEIVALLLIVEPIDLRQCKLSTLDNFAASINGDNSREQAQIKSFTHDVYRHLHNLELLTARQKLTYVLDRVSGKLTASASVLTNPVKKMGRETASWLYLRLGYRLPYSLRSDYILRVYDEAIREYLPSAYPGQLIIFNCAENSNQPQSWERLAGRGLEIHTIPGNHTDVLREPNVRIWSKKLKMYLDKAQASVHSIVGKAG
jgi:amino acid adenylation domain-containing protein